jgi:hypothetical protein
MLFTTRIVKQSTLYQIRLDNVTLTLQAIMDELVVCDDDDMLDASKSMTKDFSYIMLLERSRIFK